MTLIVLALATLFAYVYGYQKGKEVAHPPAISESAQPVFAEGDDLALRLWDLYQADKTFQIPDLDLMLDLRDFATTEGR